MFQLFYGFCSLSLTGLFLWSAWQAARDGIAQLQRLHQIPCSNCAFFTGDYRLKCTVHPSRALTEAALDCLDYEPTTYPTKVSANWSQHLRRSLTRKLPDCPHSTERSCGRANSQEKIFS